MAHFRLTRSQRRRRIGRIHRRRWLGVKRVDGNRVRYKPRGQRGSPGRRTALIGMGRIVNAKRQRRAAAFSSLTLRVYG